MIDEEEYARGMEEFLEQVRKENPEQEIVYRQALEEKLRNYWAKVESSLTQRKFK